MAVLYLSGVATGVAVVLEIQKRRDLKKRNRDLEAALTEVTVENQKLKHRN